MIDKALKVLRSELLDYLARQPDLTVTDAVQFANVTKDDGTVAVPKETVGLTLINIEEERVNKPQSPTRTVAAGQLAVVNPDLNLNLYLLFSANFTDYLTSITYLAAVIGFFQARHVFTPESSPSMDPRIERLNVELYSLNLEQQNHLWGYLGGKYLPSVVYKVRLVRIQEGIVRREGERITHIDIDGRGLGS